MILLPIPRALLLTCAGVVAMAATMPGAAGATTPLVVASSIGSTASSGASAAPLQPGLPIAEGSVVAVQKEGILRLQGSAGAWFILQQNTSAQLESWRAPGGAQLDAGSPNRISELKAVMTNNDARPVTHFTQPGNAR